MVLPKVGEGRKKAKLGKTCPAGISRNIKTWEIKIVHKNSCSDGRVKNPTHQRRIKIFEIIPNSWRGEGKYSYMKIWICLGSAHVSHIKRGG